MNELTDKIADVEIAEKPVSSLSPSLNSLQVGSIYSKAPGDKVLTFLIVQAKFADLVAQDNLAQAELFLKSFGE